MKIMKYFVATSLLLFAACNQQNQNAPADNTPTDVTIRVELPKTVSTRAAMSDLQDKVNNNDPATVEKLHVYLTDNKSNIKVAQEFTKGSPEFTKLTSSSAIAAKGGYKFKDVAREVAFAYVIANPTGAAQQVGQNLELNAELKPQVGNAVYAGQAPVAHAGSEPYGVDPDPKSKSVVKSAEVTLDAATNRIQVLGTKFTKIVWKQGKKQEYKLKLAQYVKDSETTGKLTLEQAADKFKTEVLGNETWNGQTDFSQTTKLKEWFDLVDITSKNEGILMNRFATTLTLPSKTVAEQADWMFAQTFRDDRYNTTNGTFKPDTKTDLSEVASYFKAGGFTFGGTKAAAFNFFSAGITSYAKEGNAPKVVFVFKEGAGSEGVSADHRFVVVQGYKKDGGDLNTEIVKKAGYLLDMDLSKYNDGQGVLVELDPEIPSGIFPNPSGQDDLENTNVNLIVKVTVSPWTSVNVLPILN